METFSGLHPLLEIRDPGNLGFRIVELKREMLDQKERLLVTVLLPESLPNPCLIECRELSPSDKSS